MTREVAARAAAVACGRLVALSAFAAARHVVMYLPTDHEIDPAAVVATSCAAGKTVYYPRVIGRSLEFLGTVEAPGHARHTSGDFRPGPGGVPEPLDGVRLRADAEAVLFVVPGVAFDLRGARLGRGGGHYDRALARHSSSPRVGLAFECQILPRLPEASWDVPMHAVATEARLVVGPADGAAFADVKEI